MSVAPDTPVIRFIYWLINTPGLGSLALAVLIVTCLGSLSTALHWVARGAQADEMPTYAFPSPALLDHDHPRA